MSAGSTPASYVLVFSEFLVSVCFGIIIIIIIVIIIIANRAWRWRWWRRA
jgi:membrane protein DedA with SNARE-associated domain